GDGDVEELLRRDGVFEAGRRAALTEILERVVYRLGGGVERMVPLQRDANALARQEALVGQRGRGAAQHEWQSRRPVHRLDLLALARARQKDRVDAGLLVSPHPLLGFRDAPAAQRPRAAPD